MLKSHIEAFLKAKSKKSKKTASTYRTAVASWLAWADGVGVEPLTTEGVIGFHSYLVDTTTPPTVSTYMAGIAGFLEFMDVMGEGTAVNMTRVRYEVRNGPRSYSHMSIVQLDDLRKREMPRLVEYFENYPIPEDRGDYNVRLSALRNIAIFWTLYETACRIGEARRLDRSHISHDTKTAVVTGKGNRPHTLRFGYPESRAIPAILAYLAERTDRGSALFVSHSRNSSGKRLSDTSLHLAVKNAMAATGLDERLTPHDIRHYRAIMMLRQDMPLHVIQQFLNHKDIGTTRAFYAPITDEDDMLRHLSRLDS